jgi:iron(III) transport system ATP-binding protein
MPTISLNGVEKSYVAGQLAVQHLDLTIPDGAFMCLLGPSGCGKTTTLRMIAGLEHPTAGEIRVDGTVLDSVTDGRFVPTERRQMGFVFQSYALWPHLTVRRNVDFGLRLRKVSKTERERRVQEAMTALHIADLGDRYPAQLSGGQQQRVSVARMLAVGNDVLLLDEPLSNLDAALRLEMRSELKRLHSELQHTVVFVTHDQLEAMTMATHIAVMSQGVLQQVGAPLEIYDRPANTFVAEFVGSPPMALVRSDGAEERHLPVWRFVTDTDAEVGPTLGAVGMRPEAIRLTTDEASVPPDACRFAVRVGTVLPTGATWVVSLSGPAQDMYAVTSSDPGTSPGDTMTAWVRACDLHLFDQQGQRLRSWDARHEPVRETVDVVAGVAR